MMLRSKEILSVLASLSLFAVGSSGLPSEEASRGEVIVCHQAGPVKRFTLRLSENGAAQHLTQHQFDTPVACEDGDVDL